MVILILLMFLATDLSAHGVTYTELQGGYGIQVSYESGDPLEFSDIKVFQPGESEYEFQLGMTDQNGVFMFKPDTIGIWTLKVSDGLGHGKVIQVMVDGSRPSSVETPSTTRFQKIISGIGYILFIFSVWYFIVRRRQS